METTSEKRPRSSDDDLACVLIGLRAEFDRILGHLHEGLADLHHVRRTAGRDDAAAQLGSMVETCSELRELAAEVLDQSACQGWRAPASS